MPLSITDVFTVPDVVPAAGPSISPAPGQSFSDVLQARMDAQADDALATPRPSERDQPAPRPAAAPTKPASPSKPTANADTTDTDTSRANQAPAETGSTGKAASDKKSAATDKSDDASASDTEKSDASDKDKEAAASVTVVVAPTTAPVAAAIATSLVLAAEAGTENSATPAPVAPTGEATPAAPAGAAPGDTPAPSAGPPLDPSALMKGALGTKPSQPHQAAAADATTSSAQNTSAAAGDKPAEPLVAAPSVPTASQTASQAQTGNPLGTETNKSATPTPQPAEPKTGTAQVQATPQSQAQVQTESTPQVQVAVAATTGATAQSATPANASATASANVAAANSAPTQDTPPAPTVVVSTPSTAQPSSTLAPAISFAAQLAAQDGTPQSDAEGGEAGSLPTPSATSQPAAPAKPDFATAASTFDAPATDIDLASTKPPEPVVPPQVAIPSHAPQQIEATAAVTRAEQMVGHAVVEQVAVRVVKAAAEGVDRISIALNPPELGHIEVRMEIGPNGHYKAVFAADRPQTADMLQRNAQELTRSLQDAGLQTDTGSLSFNLRGHGQQHNPGHMGRGEAGNMKAGIAEVVPEVVLPANVYAGAGGSASRLDIRV